MDSISVWIEQLKEAFIREAHADRSQAMEAYMKNNFSFIGVPAPIRKKIQKEYFEIGKEMLDMQWRDAVKLLWQQDAREFQYTAMDVLLKYKRKLSSEDIHLLEELIRNKSWWDSVDFLAGTMVGIYFSKYGERKEFFIQHWDASQYMWLQRSVIIFQLRYKKDTDVSLLFHYCRKYSENKEFFIRKAIGWALRELAKTKQKEVVRFVYETNLSGLSKREALKHIEKK